MHNRHWVVRNRGKNLKSGNKIAKIAVNVNPNVKMTEAAKKAAFVNVIAAITRLSSSALAPMKWRINAGGCQLGPRTITRDRLKPRRGGLFIAMVIPKLRFLFFGGAVIATRVPGGPTARSNSPVSE